MRSRETPRWLAPALVWAVGCIVVGVLSFVIGRGKPVLIAAGTLLLTAAYLGCTRHWTYRLPTLDRWVNASRQTDSAGWRRRTAQALTAVLPLPLALIPWSHALGVSRDFLAGASGVLLLLRLYFAAASLASFIVRTGLLAAWLCGLLGFVPLAGALLHDPRS